MTTENQAVTALTARIGTTVERHDYEPGDSRSMPWNVNIPRCGDPIQLELARIMDPVAFDPRAVPQNLGQSMDQHERQESALLHARRVLDAGWSRPPTAPGAVLAAKSVHAARQG